MKTHHPLPRAILLIVLLLSATGCDGRTVMAKNTSAPFIQGQVLDLGTNKPIPGAIVIAMWQETLSAAPIPADSRTVCSHVETAITDEQGHYQLPTWNGYEPSVYSSYKPGYIRSNEYYRLQQKVDQYVDLLEPFKGISKERIKYLDRLDSMRSCSENTKLIPLYRAIYEEAKSIAVTQEDKKIVEELLFGVESLELGSSEALRKMTEREGKAK